jgi:mannose-6-phosphate isomerase-like protein (cupin superfamily)
MSSSATPVIAAPLAGHVVGPPDGAFAIAEWADDGTVSTASRPIAPLHVHHADDEAWYVLEGVLGFRLGEQEVEARAGTAVFVPRGVPHTYWNARQAPARYLLIMTPTIRRLIDALHALTVRDAASVQAVFRQHDSELLA